MSDRQNPQALIAEWAATLRLEDLPETARSDSQTFLLDTLATMVAGSSAPGVSPVLEQYQAWGGLPESTVAVFGGRLPAPSAALVNAVMAHALDYDDTFDETGLHANVCVVPALLAVAESQGRISGAEFMSAHAAGLEVSSRLALAASSSIAPGWLPTSVFGCFGATAAVGRVIRLSPEQLLNALGIVYNFTGGNRQGLLDGALTKRIQPALYAQAAVTAACLARRGITGPSRALDGKYGLFPLFVGEGYDLAGLGTDLGRRFDFLNIGLKPYPCCRGTHASIDAALDLVRDAGTSWRDIRALVVYLASETVADLVGQPFQLRGNPQVDAQFSVSYAVAAALIRGRLGLGDFDEEAIRDETVGALARRVRVVVDPARAGTVELHLEDGATRQSRAEYPRGHPSRPLGIEALNTKLEDCARRASFPLSVDQVQSLQGLVAGLAELEDVGEIVRTTAGADQRRTMGTANLHAMQEARNGI